MILVLRCPHCANTMRYQSQGGSLAGKRKSCVYCGRSFGIAKRIVRRETP